MKDWIENVKILRAEGSLEKTIEYLSCILTNNPNSPSVYCQIAWTHDALGKEADAAPAYEMAISLGLEGEDLEGAYLGLGSTYRCLGDYQNSERVLKKGISLFPENKALCAFYALTQYNLRNFSASIELLLQLLAQTTTDEKIKRYRQALLFYSDKLDETFE